MSIAGKLLQFAGRYGDDIIKRYGDDALRLLGNKGDDAARQTNLFGKIVFFKDLIVGKYDFIVLNSFSNPSLIFLIYLLFVSNSNIVLPCYLKSLNKKKKKLFNILKIYRQFFFKKKN